MSSAEKRECLLSIQQLGATHTTDDLYAMLHGSPQVPDDEKEVLDRAWIVNPSL